MIEKTQGYKTSDGAVHATIEAAQQAEIESIAPDDSANLPKWMVENREQILAILKMKARKPRKPAVGRPKGSKNKTTAATPIV